MTRIGCRSSFLLLLLSFVLVLVSLSIQTPAWSSEVFDAKNKLIEAYKRGQFALAEQSGIIAVTQQPYDAEARYYLANSYLKLGKSDEAIAAYRACLVCQNASPTLLQYAKQELEVLLTNKERSLESAKAMTRMYINMNGAPPGSPEYRAQMSPDALLDEKMQTIDAQKKMQGQNKPVLQTTPYEQRLMAEIKPEEDILRKQFQDECAATEKKLLAKYQFYSANPRMAIPEIEEEREKLADQFAAKIYALRARVKGELSQMNS